MKLSKKQERLIVIGLAAFLVGYFCWQMAYGYDGPSMSITIPGHLACDPHCGTPVNLANDSWTMYNGTSGSVSTITFHHIWSPDKWIWL